MNADAINEARNEIRRQIDVQPDRMVCGSAVARAVFHKPFRDGLLFEVKRWPSGIRELRIDGVRQPWLERELN